MRVLWKEPDYAHEIPKNKSLLCIKFFKNLCIYSYYIENDVIYTQSTFEIVLYACSTKTTRQTW